MRPVGRGRAWCRLVPPGATLHIDVPCRYPRWHAALRWLDRVGWLWWATGDAPRYRWIWCDVITKHNPHWLCACGNRTRMAYRQRLKTEAMQRGL